MDEIVATTYLGERAGWERNGVRIGTDRYLILTREIVASNDDLVGCVTRIRSERIHATVDDALRAALGAIERLASDPTEL